MNRLIKMMNEIYNCGIGDNADEEEVLAAIQDIIGDEVQRVRDEAETYAQGIMTEARKRVKAMELSAEQELEDERSRARREGEAAEWGRLFGRG